MTKSMILYAAGGGCVVTGLVTITLTSILLQWKYTDISSVEVRILVLEICSFFNVLILTICLVREFQTSRIEWRCGPIRLRSCLCIFLLLIMVAKSGEMACFSETMLGEYPIFYDEQLLKTALILRRVVWTIAVFFQGCLCTLSLILSNIRSNQPFSSTSGDLPSPSDPILKAFRLGSPRSEISVGRLSDGMDENCVRLGSPSSMIHSISGPSTQNEAMALNRSSSHGPKLSRSLDSILSCFNASEHRFLPSPISSSASILGARGLCSPTSHQSKDTVIHVMDHIPRIGSPLSSSFASVSASELQPQLSSSPKRSNILNIQIPSDLERATAGFYLDSNTLQHPHGGRPIPPCSPNTSSLPDTYSRWSPSTASDEGEIAVTHDEMQGCRQSGSWPVQFRSRVPTASRLNFMTRATFRNSLVRFYKRGKDDSGDDGNMC